MEFQVVCLLEGAPLSKVFSVKVSSDNTVDELKDIVKARIAPKLDNVSVFDMQLWKVTVPTRSSKNTAIVLDSISFKQELDPLDHLSKDITSKEAVILIQVPVLQAPTHIIPARTSSPSLSDDMSCESESICLSKLIND
ncbi:hypothetical protein B0O80DRAFT_459469 [Mortierella sp. GBAus27b]|nr:hypothetical protein B0O80DRAFT_459469 [Mortierella sp. GBAus27b]